MGSNLMVQAGSGFGYRAAFYQIKDDGKLSLVQADQHDNLAGNAIVTDFDGKTVEEARAIIDKEMAEQEEYKAGREPDGSHAYYWQVWSELVDEVPEQQE